MIHLRMYRNIISEVNEMNEENIVNNQKKSVTTEPSTEKRSRYRKPQNNVLDIQNRCNSIDKRAMFGASAMGFPDKISPVRGEGFDRIAERLSRFEEVDSVYLMSGSTSDLYLIWNKYQTFTPIAEKFLTQVKESF